MLSEDSDTEDIHQFTINEHYAKAFEYRKEREELAKLKEKYGSDIEEDDAEEEDSEEDESEDEDGEELTPAVDAAILRTLARIRRKDPSIYEKDKDVFEEEWQKTGDASIARVQKDKSKPLRMRQHAIASALKPESRSSSPEPLTHVQEQAALRQETIAAFHTAVAEDDDDGFLIPRDKTKDDIEREEEEYRAFLEREVGEDLKEIVTVEMTEVEVTNEEEGEKAEKKKKKKKRKEEGKVQKSKREEDREFLMNYILNRGWIDRSARRLPTYDEITASKKGKRKRQDDQSDASLHSDVDEDVKDESAPEQSEGENENEEFSENEFDDIADRFESSYNFRFEEPDADTIARYPRNIPSLVRRQDSSRKEAREKRKARKEEELLKKKEEIKRLKALKMKEIRTKLEMIGREGGKSLEASKALQELDLEGDWDPEAHERQMAELYERDDEGEIDDEEKPDWDDDIDITDIAPPEEEASTSKKSKKKKKKKSVDDDRMDEGGVDVDEMDAEAEDPAIDDEEWDGTEDMRKRRLDEYMDELYGLEFNDMVGDMPTRFKYTKVSPQIFGLSPAEILVATDAELNSYMGIKKYAPYRKGGQWDQTRGARLKELKDSLRERGVDTRPEGKGENAKKRKGKKERMKERGAAIDIATSGEPSKEDESSATGRQDAGKKAKRKSPESGDAAEEAEQNAQEQGAVSKKRRRRHRKSEQA
ncbi:Krr1-domain-containing protein [Laetiporus sulphureus 93-53]|uniref:Krr1-domain-containing protein n=1 Tax=Laetiporus sulphureus 93-53 TaxID=1314785 RepID=A0A165DGP6_9APHY|nr:Krr1-domain-containing protein [Laetiporus sulphureus 93-53]KZT04845.1 Krr1-domain-containing protein [Laetiporus sulphureus 93-53]